MDLFLIAIVILVLAATTAALSYAGTRILTMIQLLEKRICALELRISNLEIRRGL